MAESDPLSDMFNLLATPLAGTIKSVEQFRRGVDEFLRGVENFNRTMENLNETAERVNSMLTEIEEPLRAAMPQITRTIQTADEVMTVMSGPAKAVAPGLASLAEVLNNPTFTQIPHQIGQVNDLLGELATRLTPLGQMAESAGGLFGGLRLPGFSANRPPATQDSANTDKEINDDRPDDGLTSPHPANHKSHKDRAAAKPATKKRSAQKTTAPKKSSRSTKKPAGS